LRRTKSKASRTSVCPIVASYTQSPSKAPKREGLYTAASFQGSRRLAWWHGMRACDPLLSAPKRMTEHPTARAIAKRKRATTKEKNGALNRAKNKAYLDALEGRYEGVQICAEQSTAAEIAGAHPNHPNHPNHHRRRRRRRRRHHNLKCSPPPPSSYSRPGARGACCRWCTLESQLGHFAC